MQPISIPPGVEVQIGEGNLIEVKGPKGTLRRQLRPEMVIEKQNGTVVVRRPKETRWHKSLHGLTRTLIANMIVGVTEGYQKVLEISGVGYRAEMQGKNIRLTVGFSHPVLIEPDEGVELAVEGGNKIIVRGIDKEIVGNMAAKIRAVRPVEPYRGKGIKYEDEIPRRKPGKQAKTAGGK